MPYPIRLLSLCFASFFLLHTLFGAILAACVKPVVRLAARRDARHAARFLFAVRLVPAGLASLLVGAFCVPSYLRLEPAADAESVGMFCLAATALGAAVWGISLARGLHALAGSARFLRDCRRAASRTSLPGHALPVWIVEKPVPPVVALAGVVHPRFVISSQLLTALSPSQMELALLHENAHRASHDNLRRLLVILAPDLFPFVNPWRTLERNRVRFTEWAADDEAAGGDPDRSLSLASTLVSVARAGSWSNPAPLLASFAGRGGADLAARVDRLLDPASSRAKRGGWFSWFANASAALTICAVLLLALKPPVLAFVHEILERLIA